MSTVPKTIERQILAKYFREGFLGPLTDQTDFSPVAIPGIDFDETVAALTAPFTPDQVRDLVGFVELSLREIDSWDGETTSGVTAAGDIVSRTYTLTRCRFEIRIPGAIEDVEEQLERREEKLRELFIGVRIVHDGPPALFFRQLAIFPPTVWSDTDDGDWRRRVLDIPIRRSERRTHAGVQEVVV